MLVPDLVVEIDTAEFDGVIERLAALGRNASPLMGLIAGEMHGAVEDNFAAQGRPAWMGLKKSTLRRRAGDHKILQASGRLANSIQMAHDSTSAVVGTNVVYAAIHQFGGTIQRHPMSGLVRLRTDRNGMLLRQANHKHLAVFAKDSHKRVAERKWTRTTGWTIKIPARPFLALTEADNTKIESEVVAYLRRLIDG